jgi:hypothetical protein
MKNALEGCWRSLWAEIFIFILAKFNKCGGHRNLQA